MPLFKKKTNNLVVKKFIDTTNDKINAMYELYFLYMFEL